MHSEYEKRLASRRDALTAHEQLFKKLSNWRLGIVVAGAALAWFNWWLLPIPIAVLIALAVYHERIAQNISCEKRAIALYERGLARLNGDWAGQGETGERFRDSAHPYAED